MGKMFFYAVAKGRKPGVYDTWEQCEEQVKGFQNAKFRKFASQNEAVAYTGLTGKQAETIRAAAGNTSTVTATLRREQESSSNVLEQRSIPSSHVASSPRVVVASVRKFEPDTREPEVVFCDGACKGNGKVGSVAGLGVWWGDEDPRNLAERVPGGQTNNRAELLAIVRILEQHPESGRSLIIKTDSRYSIDCVTKWIPNWLRNGWRKTGGQPVQNKELIHYLSTLLDLRKAIGQDVKLIHIKGHAGHLGNEMADRQANIGSTLPEIPEEPDWAAMRKVLEQRIQNLSSEILQTQTQGASSSNGVTNSAAIQQNTTVSRSSSTNGTTETQSSAANATFSAQLTEDDYYTADDILDADDLEAEFNNS
ncbi:ribonuclease H-like protein [Schizopora paradoxa]|uniref:Ribonuclease H n=1 Tax=Schizopora paradoxa TaxID=27342 RepID=A0A0H2RVJ4_9AGAM|nr:ribonuclease H-like protein [Schizopora paradoxa]